MHITIAQKHEGSFACYDDWMLVIDCKLDTIVVKRDGQIPLSLPVSGG
jgi:hypothetical protein